VVAEESGGRRPRRRRRRRGGAPDARPEGAEGAPRDAPAWRSFPALFAFAIGALVMAVLTLIAPEAFPVFLFVALFGVAFGVAHLLARNLRGYRGR
jgi:hypothetical protein